MLKDLPESIQTSASTLKLRQVAIYLTIVAVGLLTTSVVYTTFLTQTGGLIRGASAPARID